MYMCVGPVLRGVPSSALLSRSGAPRESLDASLREFSTLQKHRSFADRCDHPFAPVTIFSYLSSNMAIAVITFMTYFWANRIILLVGWSWFTDSTPKRTKKWQVHETQQNSQVVCGQMPSVTTRLQKSHPEAPAMVGELQGMVTSWGIGG